MGYSRSIRRVRALAVATRMSVSIGVAVLVAATVMPLPTALASDTPPPPPDRTALVLGGTTVPTPDSAYIDAVRNHFIGPTHPGETIDYIPVTAPMEFWPITGVLPPCLAGDRAAERLGSRWSRLAG